MKVKKGYYLVASVKERIYNRYMKKYKCHSGIVFSADGEVHEIDASRLPALYGIKPEECIFIRSSKDLLGYTDDFLAGLITLRPRSDGKYELPQM